MKFTTILKFLTSLPLAISILIIFSSNLYAIENPLSSANNPFGIHILNENELDDAAKLVNSSGGDWGYVTLVIRKDERDSERWQQVFDKMRKLHLIPIARLATIQQNGGWEKPNVDEIDGWVSFLNSLIWVVKNRYIIIGNEPNHAKEWGGELNPEEYSDYLYSFSKKLNETSNDFFILSAGFDASAANTNETMSAENYIKNMITYKPESFEFIDGWNSHSYPNPNFSGSEDSYGRGSVRTFEWELNLLKSFGINKNLPVFITETGWSHNMDGTSKNSKLITQNDISERIRNAYSGAWQDPRIVTVTPFVLNYQEPPFDIFSWKKKDGNFYSFYYEIQDIPKIPGKPLQSESAQVVAVIFPPIFKNKEKPLGVAYVKNTGQTIWNGDEKIQVGNGVKFEIEPKVISDVAPGESTIALFRLIL